MPIRLGAVSHFSLAVTDPAASADWWSKSFDLEEWGRSDTHVMLGNESVIVSLFAGIPDPKAIGHIAFHVSDAGQLRAAVEILRANGVNLEDPGAEIGPVAEGSTSSGLWFHDPDGYRWELFVAGPPPG